LQATVLEVKTMEGLGTTIDSVLVNGALREGDRIIVCGLGGPIVTRIKALKTPHHLKEIRVKGQMLDHKEIKAAMGVRIVAPGLEQAVAGTQVGGPRGPGHQPNTRTASSTTAAHVLSQPVPQKLPSEPCVTCKGSWAELSAITPQGWDKCTLH
jgi:translation initiation factor IF-2